MPQALTDYVKRWCDHHGWTDLFVERYEYWAFPPGGVMPTPIPMRVLEDFAQSRAQRATVAYGITIAVAMLGVVLSYGQQSPMPLTWAFCIGAMMMAFVDD